MKLFGITATLIAMACVLAEASTQGFRPSELAGEAITSPQPKLAVRAMQGAGSKLKARLVASKRAEESQQCKEIRSAIVDASKLIVPGFRKWRDGFISNGTTDEDYLEPLYELSDVVEEKSNLASNDPGFVLVLVDKVEDFSGGWNDSFKNGVIPQAAYDTLHKYIQTVFEEHTKYKNAGCS
ncbi:hypothetical protein BGZ95_006403, partial [Linnemannia exigua]